MKLLPHSRGTESGSAVIIIIFLIAVMLALLASNAAALRHLKEEMRLVEKKQQRALKMRLEQLRAAQNPGDRHGQNSHD